MILKLRTKINYKPKIGKDAIENIKAKGPKQ